MRGAISAGEEAPSQECLVGGAQLFDLSLGGGCGADLHCPMRLATLARGCGEGSFGVGGFEGCNDCFVVGVHGMIGCSTLLL